MTASISDEHKSLILEEVESFMQRKRCVKRELLSLIGKLSFACKVVPAGRISLHRLIDFSMTVKHLPGVKITVGHRPKSGHLVRLAVHFAQWPAHHPNDRNECIRMRLRH